MGVATFILGTVVQEFIFTRRQMSKDQLSLETLVQTRLLSKEPFVSDKFAEIEFSLFSI